MSRRGIENSPCYTPIVSDSFNFGKFWVKGLFFFCDPELNLSFSLSSHHISLTPCFLFHSASLNSSPRTYHPLFSLQRLFPTLSISNPIHLSYHHTADVIQP